MITRFRGDYAFLSNMHQTPITIGGITFPTVEHYFQHEKALHHESKMRILSSDSPLYAKSIGRAVTRVGNWEQIKLGVMRTAIAAKFTQHDGLAVKLDTTGDHWLIEGNTWGDKFWGAVEEVSGSGDWDGQNWLGFILMAQRAIIRAI